MTIKLDSVKIQGSAEQGYNYLTQVANFEYLMPENIQKFEILSSDSFAFILSGMPRIALQIQQRNPHSHIQLGAMNDKLSFTLDFFLSDIDSTHGQVQLNFEGKFNAMMKMMVKNPLTNFLNQLQSKLSEVVF